jgi:hypothetical protein
MEVSSQLHVPAALPLGKTLRDPLDRGWVGPRVGLDAVERKKICTIRNEIRAGQSVARRYTDWDNPALFCLTIWVLFQANSLKKLLSINCIVTRCRIELLIKLIAYMIVTEPIAQL